MVSWELSEVKERIVRKKKKRNRTNQFDDEQLLEPITKDTTAAGNKEDEIYSSEDGDFYSAPESPLSSDETTGSVVTTIRPAAGSIALPEPVTKRGPQPKRKKKQKAKLRKVARQEFFRPICELFEDEDSVLTTVSDLSLSDMRNVLSLTELCLMKMKEIVKSKYHSVHKV